MDTTDLILRRLSDSLKIAGFESGQVDDFFARNAVSLRALAVQANPPISRGSVVALLLRALPGSKNVERMADLLHGLLIRATEASYYWQLASVQKEWQTLILNSLLSGAAGEDLQAVVSKRTALSNGLSQLIAQSAPMSAQLSQDVFAQLPESGAGQYYDYNLRAFGVFGRKRTEHSQFVTLARTPAALPLDSASVDHLTKRALADLQPHPLRSFTVSRWPISVDTEGFMTFVLTSGDVIKRG